jgi:hypothetical protein
MRSRSYSNKGYMTESKPRVQPVIITYFYILNIIALLFVSTILSFLIIPLLLFTLLLFITLSTL